MHTTGKKHEINPKKSEEEEESSKAHDAQQEWHITYVNTPTGRAVLSLLTSTRINGRKTLFKMASYHKYKRRGHNNENLSGPTGGRSANS